MPNDQQCSGAGDGQRGPFTEVRAECGRALVVTVLEELGLQRDFGLKDFGDGTILLSVLRQFGKF